MFDHYSSPGQLAEYKRQIQRAFRRPGDDPSIFTIKLEKLARRAFVDIDPLIQLQMVWDRFIDGQAECALRRHLVSLGPDTPMADIVGCSCVWESHSELASGRQMGTDRQSPRAICQVTVDGSHQLSRRRLNHWRTSLESCCRRRRNRLRRRPPSSQTRISSFSD